MREIVDELRTDGPREDEFERARAYAAGRRVLAFENTNAVARHAATQTVVFGQEIDPDAVITALDETTFEAVAEVARGVSEELSVACVGPHGAASSASGSSVTFTRKTGRRRRQARTQTRRNPSGISRVEDMAWR